MGVLVSVPHGVRISFFVREIGREVDIFQYFLKNSNLTVFMGIFHITKETSEKIYLEVMEFHALFHNS